MYYNKRRRSGDFNVPRKRARTTYGYRVRPVRTQNYTNLVLARPRRVGPLGMAPLASRGWNFPNTGEKKVLDIATGTVQVNTTGSISLLNGCIQGTDYTQRIGRKIVLKSVYIRGRVQSEASIGPSPVISAGQMARLIIVIDTQPNGVIFAITDLLNTSDPSSQLNLNNRDRFMILCDKLYVIDPFAFSTTATTAYASMSNQIHRLKIFKKLKMETIFNAGNAGTIADMTSGALYMVWIGSIAAGAQDMNAVVSTRVRFQDP